MLILMLILQSILSLTKIKKRKKYELYIKRVKGSGYYYWLFYLGIMGDSKPNVILRIAHKKN